MNTKLAEKNVKVNISFISRKTNVLSPSSLDCFRKKIITINSTLGCSHQCAYCYARGYLFYPGDQNIVIYDNLVKKLRQELPRKRKLPEVAFFSTSCDVFQPVHGLTDNCNQLDVYFKTMKDSNVKSIVLNYLLLKNMIKKNLKNALSSTCFNKIIALYKSGKKMALNAPNSRALVLDTIYRKSNYDKISNIAGKYDINTYVCGCKNLDITNNMICSKVL